MGFICNQTVGISKLSVLTLWGDSECLGKGLNSSNMDTSKRRKGTMKTWQQWTISLGQRNILEFWIYFLFIIWALATLCAYNGSVAFVLFILLSFSTRYQHFCKIPRLQLNRYNLYLEYIARHSTCFADSR